MRDMVCWGCWWGLLADRIGFEAGRQVLANDSLEGMEGKEGYIRRMDMKDGCDLTVLCPSRSYYTRTHSKPFLVSV